MHSQNKGKHVLANSIFEIFLGVGGGGEREGMPRTPRGGHTANSYLVCCGKSHSLATNQLSKRALGISLGCWHRQILNIHSLWASASQGKGFRIDT